VRFINRTKGSVANGGGEIRSSLLYISGKVSQGHKKKDLKREEIRSTKGNN